MNVSQNNRIETVDVKIEEDDSRESRLIERDADHTDAPLNVLGSNDITPADVKVEEDSCHESKRTESLVDPRMFGSLCKLERVQEMEFDDCEDDGDVLEQLIAESIGLKTHAGEK